jgi:hypothetical protein
MIDIHNENLINLRTAAKLRPCGRKGRPTHVSTVHRWIQRGVRGIRLEAVRIGGSLFTSREALQRFAERLTGSPDVSSPPRPATSDTSSTSKVDQELSRDGW